MPSVRINSLDVLGLRLRYAAAYSWFTHALSIQRTCGRSRIPSCGDYRRSIQVLPNAR